MKILSMFIIAATSALVLGSASFILSISANSEISNAKLISSVIRSRENSPTYTENVKNDIDSTKIFDVNNMQFKLVTLPQ